MNQPPPPLQKPSDTEEQYERKRAIVLGLVNIVLTAEALQAMGAKIRRGIRPSDEVLANRCDGLARLLTELVMLIDSEATASRPVWH